MNSNASDHARPPTQAQWLPPCQSCMPGVRNARHARLDSLFALLAPLFALLTFPSQWVRPSNPLYFYLGALVPDVPLLDLPRTCSGTPYGSLEEVRLALLVDLGSDLFVFTVALGALCLANAVSIRSTARDTPRVAPGVCAVTVCCVFAWASFCCCGLATM